MTQSFVKYLVTGTCDVPFKDLIAEYDPLLLEEVNLVLSSMLGGTCNIRIEDIELLAVEESEE